MMYSNVHIMACVVAVYSAVASPTPQPSSSWTWSVSAEDAWTLWWLLGCDMHTLLNGAVSTVVNDLVLKVVEMMMFEAFALPLCTAATSFLLLFCIFSAERCCSSIPCCWWSFDGNVIDNHLVCAHCTDAYEADLLGVPLLEKIWLELDLVR